MKAYELRLQETRWPRDEPWPEPEDIRAFFRSHSFDVGEIYVFVNGNVHATLSVDPSKVWPRFDNTPIAPDIRIAMNVDKVRSFRKNYKENKFAIDEQSTKDALFALSGIVIAAMGIAEDS